MLLLMELHGLLAAMLIIIFTAPVFAGEYSLKMEELLQTAANGMEKTACGKAAAVLTLSLSIFGDSSGFGLFIYPLCLGKRNLESRYDAACGRRTGYCSGCQLRPGFYCLIFPGDLRRILLAGAVYCLSTFAHTPFQSATGAGIGYFVCQLLYNWGIRAGFLPAAYLFSFSPVVLARFQLFRKPWEGKWFGGFYLWLVPVITIVLCAVFFLSGRRRFLRKPG